MDCPELRDLLLYLGTQLGDEDIPHRTKLSELITQRFKVEYANMVQEISVGLFQLLLCAYLLHLSFSNRLDELPPRVMFGLARISTPILLSRRTI